jgi:hypothetical protein
MLKKLVLPLAVVILLTGGCIAVDHGKAILIKGDKVQEEHTGTLIYDNGMVVIVPGPYSGRVSIKCGYDTEVKVLYGGKIISCYNQKDKHIETVTILLESERTYPLEVYYDGVHKYSGVTVTR